MKRGPHIYWISIPIPGEPIAHIQVSYRRRLGKRYYISSKICYDAESELNDVFIEHYLPRISDLLNTEWPLHEYLKKIQEKNENHN
jgi:hypothetical protein